ncbi:SphA family protein [Methylobacterium nonmethylotrophicum]|uniref:SphA family protein n=1 Tax=Methylobacterium nonmethylotrophicum TaxID=1141884 RepID=UPI001FE0BC90|nr:transporter [Methylobacterium nonmethylotrophicum]
MQPVGRPRRRRRTTCASAAFAALAGFAGSAHAYDMPALNLGFTSFFDGAPPSGPGWYPSQYLQVYSAGRLTDNRGRSLGLPREDVTVIAELTQLIYVSPIKVGPGTFGLNLILPALPHAAVNDGLNGAVLKAREGVGDLLVGPFYQGDPVMGPNGPIFMGRIEASVILPTGRYDPTAAVNPGSNYLSFDPYVAGTLFLTPDWSVSGRFHYLWNARNDRPNVSFGPAISTTQAGQALHANFATDYKLTKDLVVGANGYWLQQITDTLANGVAARGHRERVFALGPGALWSINADNFLFFNAYYEFGARNRPEGQRYIMRYVGHFN